MFINGLWRVKLTDGTKLAVDPKNLQMKRETDKLKRCSVIIPTCHTESLVKENQENNKLSEDARRTKKRLLN